MKKITRIFALALALVMAFALQAPVSAAEKASVQAVNQEKAQVDTQASRITAQITYLSETGVGISINNPDSDYVEVQIRDYKGKVVKTSYNISYSSFSLSKNKLYSFRFRRVYYSYSDGKYIPISDWSNSPSFTTAKYKVSQVGKSRKVKIKTPKVAGIKNYKIYMSTKKKSGWKKIKTVKAGKAITVSRFKGKSFKYYKNYYYKIVPSKGQSYSNGFYFYKYSTFR